MEMNEAQRASIGERVAAERRAQFATKSAAYRAARLNAATWDRIESGLPVREDRLIAAIRTLWPPSGGDWRRIGPQLQQYDGPQPERRPYVPPTLGEQLRQSIHNPRELEFDYWVQVVNLRLDILDQMTGAAPRPGLEERDVSVLSAAIRHQKVSPEVEASALRILADFAADPERVDIHHDHRARLLYGFAQMSDAPGYLAGELVRRFGEFDPDVDPGSVADLAFRPPSAQIHVDLVDEVDVPGEVSEPSARQRQ